MESTDEVMIMKLQAAIAMLLAMTAIGQAQGEAATDCPPILRYEARGLKDSAAVNFCSAYQGKVLLAVNTASQCGYTPQFAGLEALYQTFKSRGLVVLGFPSNDFKQEHDNAEETARVSYGDYGVTFPMFAKSTVSGNSANPFFKELARQTGNAPQWNFQKYLVGADGKVIRVYPANVAPDDLILRADIEAALGAVKP
jgi:glutathione peroxidase